MQMSFCIVMLMTLFLQVLKKILLLKLLSTNNNPRVTLLYYLTAVLQRTGNAQLLCNVYFNFNNNKGCPTLLCCDKGTENSLVAACHMTLRHNHSDMFSGEKSFRYGSSTTNTVSKTFHALIKKEKLFAEN